MFTVDTNENEVIINIVTICCFGYFDHLTADLASCNVNQFVNIIIIMSPAIGLCEYMYVYVCICDTVCMYAHVRDSVCVRMRDCVCVCSCDYETTWIS